MFNRSIKRKFIKNFEIHFENNFNKTTKDFNYKLVSNDTYDSYSGKKSSFCTNEMLNSEFDPNKFKEIYSSNFHPIEGYRLINTRVMDLQDDGKKIEDMYEDSLISKSYFTKIRNGEKVPTKLMLIKLCIGLELNYSSVMKLMKAYGHTLSPTIEFDFAATYFFTEWEYKKSHRGKCIAMINFQGLMKSIKDTTDLFHSAE